MHQHYSCLVGHAHKPGNYDLLGRAATTHVAFTNLHLYRSQDNGRKRLLTQRHHKVSTTSRCSGPGMNSGRAWCGEWRVMDGCARAGKFFRAYNFKAEIAGSVFSAGPNYKTPTGSPASLLKQQAQPADP